jgi:hypothetical protein
MKWIAAAAALIPFTASACLAHAQPSGGMGLANLFGVVVANCVVGWATYRIAMSSGKREPAAAAKITAVASLFGGPLLWFILTHAQAY